MTQQQVVGTKTKNIYFTGDAIACRRFINDNAILKTVGKGKSEKKRSEFEFKEVRRIV